MLFSIHNRAHSPIFLMGANWLKIKQPTIWTFEEYFDNIQTQKAIFNLFK